MEPPTAVGIPGHLVAEDEGFTHRMRMRDSIILWYRCGRARSEQCSTGALHLDGFESLSLLFCNKNGLMPTPLQDAFISPWILPRAKKCPPDTFYTSVRTGAALSNPFSSSANNKTHTERCGFYYWQRMRDSNPRKRSQSPVCYRYTNPLSHERLLLYARNGKSQDLFSVFAKFSHPFYNIFPRIRRSIQTCSQGKGFPFKTCFLIYIKVSFSPRSRSISSR